MFEEAGVGGHEAGEDGAVLFGKSVPGGVAGVTRGELGVGGDDAQGELAFVAVLAGFVPALFEGFGVFVGVGFGDLDGGVGGAVGEVEEEGFLGVGGAVVTQHFERLAGDVDGEVIAGGGGGGDGVVVFDEVGFVLVGPAGEEAVPAVKAFLEGPVGAVARRFAVGGGVEVPLACAVGGVAVGGEDLGDGGGGWGDAAAGVGVALVGAGEFLHADGVAVAAGEEGGARGGADGLGVEVVIEQAGGGEGVDVGGVDFGAETVEVGEAGVVQEDVYDVGGGGFGLGEGGGFGVRGEAADGALELDGDGGGAGEEEGGEELAAGEAAWHPDYRVTAGGGMQWKARGFGAAGFVSRYWVC